MAEPSDTGVEVPATGVVSLAARRQEQEAAIEARRELLEAVRGSLGALFGAAVNAAMTGPWRQWSDAQPVGTSVDISPQAFAETNDAAVAAVGRALMALEEAVEALEKAR